MNVMRIRELKQLGGVSKFFLFLGVAIFLIGSGINVFWFLYFGLKFRILFLPALELYVGNLLPGVLLIGVAIFTSYFAKSRWQNFLAFGIGGLCITLSLIWAVGANSGAFVGVLTLSSSVTEGPTSSNTPQEMFRYTIRDPIPASVRHLEGVGDTWQGYSIYLRFQTSQSDIDALIASGYQPIKCPAIADRFVLPKGYNRFKPSWNPNLSSSNRCYEANAIKNKWTGSGSHYLVVDPKSGTVYFFGIGA
jgi:hypothetical protein